MMMRTRKRATGRFYVFLFILLVLIFFLVRPLLNIGGAREAVIMAASSEYSRMMDCVFIRSEDVVSSESVVRMEYLAPENTYVNHGDIVAYVYSAGYSEKLLGNLEATRTSIQAYHKNVILADIKDAALARCDTIVDMMAAQFKALVTGETRGSMLTVSRQLSTAMVNRQDYLRQNKREDTKLTKLYEEENTRMGSIQSWRRVEKARSGGVISFYTDGYEDVLNGNTIETLSVNDVKTVLAGGKLAGMDSRSVPLFRLVEQDRWYLAVLADTNVWNPVIGQNYYLQVEGCEDLSYAASVVSVQKENETVLAVFESHDPIGPLIYRRTGRAMFSITLSGLSVTSKAVSVYNGQTGVWVYDIPGGTFVPVEVLSNDGTNALIAPYNEGALAVGQRVLIK